jgi:DNA invertase Pin-like site-specific DNA recombinase
VQQSTARQYALAERARALGCSKGTIEIIGEDLGRSGATAHNRSEFSCLTQGVARGEAGAIFAVEVSRLPPARCSQDWQRLLALCAVAGAVAVDEQAIYDPQDGDDKLLLDFKGTMSASLKAQYEARRGERVYQAVADGVTSDAIAQAASALGPRSRAARAVLPVARGREQSEQGGATKGQTPKRFRWSYSKPPPRTPLRS